MDEKRTNASGRARRFCAWEEDAGREAAERRICEEGLQQPGLALDLKQSLVYFLLLLVSLDWRKLESGEASEDWSFDQSLSRAVEEEDEDEDEDEQLAPVLIEDEQEDEEKERPFSSRLSFPWI